MYVYVIYIYIYIYIALLSLLDQPMVPAFLFRRQSEFNIHPELRNMDYSPCRTRP